MGRTEQRGSEQLRSDPPEELQVEAGDARDEPEVQLFAAERLAFFTDAVVAIAITLLALDLELPEGESWAAIGRSIGANADGYLAFLITFFIIASAWTGHHSLFRYVTKADRLLLWQNLLWLLLIVVAPFFTRMIVDDKVLFQFGFVCYAAVQVLLALMLSVMIGHAVRAHLVMETMPPHFLRRLRMRSLVVGIPFTLSIGAVFVPAIGDRAFVFWWAGPLITAGLLTVWRRWHERSAGAGDQPTAPASSLTAADADETRSP